MHSLQARARPAARRVPARQVVSRVSAVEIAQVADEAGFIAGTAATMFGITLVGLALGFVLLRVGKFFTPEEEVEGKLNSSNPNKHAHTNSIRSFILTPRVYPKSF